MLIKFPLLIPPRDDDASDSRRSGRRDGLRALKVSLIHHGLLQSILVRPATGKKYHIADGRRRYWAFQELIQEGELPKTFEIVCTQVGEGVSDLDASLAANTLRAPLHPIDEYEDFAALIVEEGMTPATVAKRYGRTKRQIEQALALGNKLSTRARQAWRAGQLSNDDVQGLTLGSQERQDEMLQAVIDGNVSAREAMLGYRTSFIERDALAFVTPAAYRRAGGVIIPDLFGDTDVVEDREKLLGMAREKLEKACKDAESAGRPFALIASDLKPGDASNYTDADENDRNAGVILQIGDGGVLVSRLVRRITVAESQPRKARGAKAKEATNLGIPPRAVLRFAEIVNAVARQCIEASPDLAETILCAAMTGTTTPSSVFHFSARMADDDAQESFKARLDAVAEMGIAEREELFCKVVANCVNVMAIATAVDGPAREAAGMILELIPKADFDAALETRLASETQAFNLLDRKAKALIIREIKPGTGDPGKLSDAALHREVQSLIRGSNWLPPEIRTIGITADAVQ